ncbi:hypothetical protein GCM10011579_012320 [Streptomyces albiflavescens]|uniref:Lipoprotein n=1 Tax=Streptomyces albiflavescens TaxID=1623582 RepID=A0A918D0B0_9ACTN|nr:hypothetical protein [Streptomyces albiflavescens]GGN53796.1 hypothetical protein GCM10011579_012320 [Streptomyces albiflavescens]
MRSMRLTLCAGAVVAAACTPLAYAADDGVSVTPSSPAPGSDIQLRATGCTDQAGTAKSAAFVTDAQLTGQGGGVLLGETRVPTSLTPGTYAIKVSCDGDDGKVGGTVVVVPQGGSNAAVPASPVAPVQAGGGGTARFASVDAKATGPGTKQAVIGLVLASVAAVAVALRSARRGRDSRD